MRSLNNVFTLFLVGTLLALTILPFTLAPAHALPANPKVDQAKIDATWDSLNDEQKKVANEVMKNLMSNGYSREAAAAIGGNFWQESTWNPTLQVGGGACGLYQALDRKEHLFKHAGVSNCSQLTVEGTMKAYHADTWNFKLLGDPSGPANYPSHSAHALDGAAEAGVTGATIPSSTDSFGSAETFKTTKDWYFATWIFAVNWERCGGAEALFMKRTLYTATLLSKADGGSSSSSPANTPQSGTSGGFVSEQDLQGMPSKPIVPKGDDIPDSKYENLSTGQKVNIGDIKDNLSEGFWGQVSNATRILLVTGGILLYAYAVILFLALIADVTTPSLGLFTLATFKRIPYTPDKGIMKPALTIFSVVILAALLQTGYLLWFILVFTDFLVSLA